MTISSTANPHHSYTSPAPGAPASDRWIFFFTGVLFFVTVLAGFIPSSLEKIAAVEAGQRGPLPLVLHVHAVLMGAWILLLLTQVTLVKTSHRKLHQKLGVVSFGLMPAMVITGFLLVPAGLRNLWALDPSVMPPGELDITKDLVANIMLGQIRVGILFPAFVCLALYFRKSDPGTHKRLMILATALPMPAAIDRISWLPSTFPESFMSADLYVLLWLSPLFAWDVMRHRKVHRAWVMWLAAFIPTSVVIQLLWGSQWWLDTAPGLVGL